MLRSHVRCNSQQFDVIRGVAIENDSQHPDRTSEPCSESVCGMAAFSAATYPKKQRSATNVLRLPRAWPPQSLLEESLALHLPALRSLWTQKQQLSPLRHLHVCWLSLGSDL